MSNTTKNTALGREIGVRIMLLRAENAEKQEELAAAVGVSREIIQHWESGTRHIKAEHIIALANHFHVHADYILGLSPVKNTEPDAQAVGNYLGLSDGAIIYLRELYEEHLKGLECPQYEMLSELLESQIYSYAACHGPVSREKRDEIRKSDSNIDFDILLLLWKKYINLRSIDSAAMSGEDWAEEYAKCVKMLSDHGFTVCTAEEYSLAVFGGEITYTMRKMLDKIVEKRKAKGE